MRLFAIFPQALRKLVQFEDFSNNEELTMAWVQGKLERQAAHEQLRAVASAIEEFTGLGFEAWRMPEWCCVRPVVSNEVRLQLPSGESILRNLITKENTLRMPLQALESSWPIQSHTIDRGTIGSSAVHSAQHCNILAQPWRDWFQGQRYAIKNAAKNTGSFMYFDFAVAANPGAYKKPGISALGWMWNSIVEWTAPANFNKGPFNSYQWFHTKQEHLQRWMAEHTIYSDAFQE